MTYRGKNLLSILLTITLFISTFSGILMPATANEVVAEENGETAEGDEVPETPDQRTIDKEALQDLPDSPEIDELKKQLRGPDSQIRIIVTLSEDAADYEGARDLVEDPKLTPPPITCRSCSAGGASGNYQADSAGLP